MKTYTARPADIERRWLVVDADGRTLGRLATQVATVLKGKHKPIYTPHMDTGDHVVVINASKIRLTGRKEQNKLYRSYSGYPGGLKEISAGKLRAKRPERMVKEAILGMLPKNKLGNRMASRLRVYRGPQHPHAGQGPRPAA